MSPYAELSGTKGRYMPRIRSITIDELDKIGLDENNKLYWEERPVVLEEKIKLQWWVNLSAIAGALSGITLAVIEVLRYCSGN
ncbi:hypothetical protein [Rhodoferax sp. U11-2br]|uniref:hypothetical protein n=1 Tax=Rhodoferax sp. U11-2br TaxID=2838878 RepID=UPI001BE77D2F|nr:hypothetical protein [Rhodoferax sp. U11-2br]MBT3068707.1 hypothetical protein [Rhodoferax sp. U11-2br]